MNILFPPIAVMLLTNSLNADVLLNSILFLLAVIPSHIHGFYLSMTYFNRKRKVRRGVYPGDKHSGIWSDRINQGGATRKEYLRLKEEKEFGKRKSNTTRNNSWKLLAGDSSEGMERVPSRGSRAETPRPGVSRQLSNRIERWDDGFDSDTVSTSSQSQSQTTGVAARRSRTAQRRQSGRSGHLQTQTPRTRSRSRSASRPRSLTRQLSDRLEDTVRRRLTEREDRRRQRRDEEDYYGEGDSYASTEPVQMAEVQRWR
jgi:uncharacterized membrane protein YqaE (UPF0057 family)